MKKILIIFGLLGVVLFCGLHYNVEQAKSELNELVENGQIRNGDIIFQTSLSLQNEAIQHATNSVYSHCGIIYKENGRYYVFEAVQPIKSTPLDKWIARGKDGRFVIKRLKNSEEILTSEALKKIKAEADKFKGKKYDLTFEWSDEKIYCSELIWKIYKRATGIELGKLQKLEEFDLSNPIVKAKLQELYGNNIPKDEVVISPKAIFDSKLLFTVKSN